MIYMDSKAPRRGFTIVELVVVIIVIGILASITIVSYAALTRSANQTTAETDVRGMASVLNKFKSENGTYPANLSVVPNTPKVNSVFRYTYSGSGGGSYCLTAFVDKASAYVVSGNSTTKTGACPGHTL